MCIPTTTNFANTWDNAKSILAANGGNFVLVAAIVDEFGNETYFDTLVTDSTANSSVNLFQYIKSNGIERLAFSSDTYSYDINRIFFGKTVYDGANGSINGIDRKNYEIHQQYSKIASGQISVSTIEEADAYFAPYGMTFMEASKTSQYFTEFEMKAAQNGWHLTWVEKPTDLTITKPSQMLLDRIAQEDMHFKTYANDENYPVINFTDLINGGQDIVIHSCMYAEITDFVVNYEPQGALMHPTGYVTTDFALTFRINDGAWQTVSKSDITLPTDYVPTSSNDALFWWYRIYNQILKDSDGKLLVTDGDADAPFKYFNDGWIHRIIASSSPVMNETKTTITKIDFKVEPRANGVMDLTKELFGLDTSVVSCAYHTWSFQDDMLVGQYGLIIPPLA